MSIDFFVRIGWGLDSGISLDNRLFGDFISLEHTILSSQDNFTVDIDRDDSVEAKVNSSNILRTDFVAQFLIIKVFIRVRSRTSIQ